jgi:regulator of protease activity HflC (stomatin/prohibitin superfamily)
MGLLHSLVNWGIRGMDNTETDLQRIGQRLGFMPLSWQRIAMMNPSKRGLLWRVPDPDVAMASSLSRIQAIIVSEYERAMVLKDGMLIEQVVLPPGLYDISRTVQIRGQIEIIWTTTTEFQLRWGVSDVLTQDRVSIGASGFYTAAIIAPDIFLGNVAGHEQVYTKEHLSQFAKSELASALRDLMARKSVMEFQLARREFIDASREMLQPIFDRWGLEFRGLTIENQQIPEEFRQAASAQVKIRLEKEAQLEGAKADVDLAQLEAQKRYFLAQAEATKFYVIQDAEVESMRRQIGIGLDPLKLKMAEAMEKFATHPGQGSLVDNRAQVIAQLSAGINAPNANTPMGVENAVNPPPAPPVGPLWGSSVSGNQPGGVPGSIVIPGAIPPVDQTRPTGLPSFVPPMHPAGTPATLSSSGPLATGETKLIREKIEEMLDKLDDRFANGEMSEQTYLMMREKWQKKLDTLPNSESE